MSVCLPVSLSLSREVSLPICLPVFCSFLCLYLERSFSQSLCLFLCLCLVRSVCLGQGSQHHFSYFSIDLFNITQNLMQILDTSNGTLTKISLCCSKSPANPLLCGGHNQLVGMTQRKGCHSHLTQ